MDKNNIQLGETTLNELLDAQKVMTRALAFIADNKDSQDEEIRKNAHLALMAVIMHDMFTKPVIGSLVREIGESIEAEKANKKNDAHISITVPVSREKS